MSGLFRNDPDTREGKYPVLLRRDGTVPEWEWFVLGARDPAAITAIRHYADDAKALGWDPKYVADLYALAESWMASQSAERLDRLERAQATRYADDPLNSSWFEPPKPADPDGPRHRTDDPNVLTFPGSLAEFAAKVRAEALHDAMAACREVRDSEAMRNPDGSRPGAAAGCCGAIAHLPGFDAPPSTRRKGRSA